MRGSAAARLLRLRVRKPPGAWIFVFGEWCVVRNMFLRRADHWPRGVLSTVLCPASVVAKPRHGKPWHGNRSKGFFFGGVGGRRGAVLQKPRVLKGRKKELALMGFAHVNCCDGIGSV